MTIDAVLPDHLRLRQCRHGALLYPVHDRYLGRMLDLYGEFSEEETEAFAALLRPGNTVVEAGANIGAHTLGIARIVGPAGRVLAFEPQRAIFQLLCANMALNGISCVEAHWAAVGSTQSRLAVPRLNLAEPHNFGGVSLDRSRTEPGAREELVPVATVDSLDLPACHFIKVDVEGMEAEVLRGAAATIARHRPVIYAENDRPAACADLLHLLEAMGYQSYWHTPPYVRVPNYRGNPDNHYPGIVSFNVLCVPRDLQHEITGLPEARASDPWPF
jgi:FkbM family methyltransferase